MTEQLIRYGTEDEMFLEVPDVAVENINMFFFKSRLGSEKGLVWWAQNGEMYVLVHGSVSGNRVLLDGKRKSLEQLAREATKMDGIHTVFIISCGGGNLTPVSYKGLKVVPVHDSPFPVWAKVIRQDMFDETGCKIGTSPFLHLDFTGKGWVGPIMQKFMKHFRRFTKWVRSWKPKKMKVITD